MAVNGSERLRQCSELRRMCQAAAKSRPQSHGQRRGQLGRFPHQLHSILHRRALLDFVTACCQNWLRQLVRIQYRPLDPETGDQHRASSSCRSAEASGDPGSWWQRRLPSSCWVRSRGAWSADGGHRRHRSRPARSGLPSPGSWSAVSMSPRRRAASVISSNTPAGTRRFTGR